MTYKVRIFLRGPKQNAGRYIGERHIEDIPRLNGLVVFQDQAGMRSGKVEGIFPHGWEPASELIPSIHLAQDADT